MTQIALIHGSGVRQLITANPTFGPSDIPAIGTILNIPQVVEASADVPTLNPDLPDSSVVTGSFVLYLDLGDDEQSYFVDPPAEPPVPETASITNDAIGSWLSTASQGVFNPELFVDTGWIRNKRDLNDASLTVRGISVGTAWQQYLQGRKIRLYPLSGDEIAALPTGADVTSHIGYEFVDAFRPLVHGSQKLFLIERYSLTSFVGDYGTGRIIKTFSLLPGETAELRVSSYKDSAISLSRAMSILDSSSSETLEEFSEAIREETGSAFLNSSSHIDSELSVQARPFKLEVGAKASVDATLDARSEFAHDITDTLRRNVANASSARDVQIDTSIDEEIKEGSTDASIRTVANINTGRTLNFIFYQMNQEYDSILHLTDIDIGHDDGHGNIEIVPVAELDSLLERIVVADHQATVRERLVLELTGIEDHRGDTHPLFVVEEQKTELSADLAASDPELRVNHHYMSSYSPNRGLSDHVVPGVIVDVESLILRTDGVYVESLLGQTSAWEPHTELLKSEELRELRLKNDAIEKDIN